jgi:hypothetical protein
MAPLSALMGQLLGGCRKVPTTGEKLIEEYFSAESFKRIIS